MSDVESVRIFYPVFAMFLLVSVVLLRMRSQRVAAVRNQEVDASFYKAYPDGGEPESLREEIREVSAEHYFASAFVLAAMWATLLVQLLRAG